MKEAVHLPAIVALLSQGHTQAHCAQQIGVSPQRIQQIVKKYGVKKMKKEKVECEYRKKKYAFMLGPNLYQECKARFRRKVQNCKTKKVPFDVSFDEIEWPTHCPVLGIELDYYGILGARNDSSVSFDRVNSLVGYVPGNVRIISWRANRIKNDGTAEEHRKVADYIESYDI